MLQQLTTAPQHPPTYSLPSLTPPPRGTPAASRHAPHATLLQPLVVKITKRWCSVYDRSIFILKSLGALREGAVISRKPPADIESSPV